MGNNNDTPELIWFVGVLQPGANELFNAQFYPKPDKDGRLNVWFARVAITDTKARYLIASKPHHTGVKIVTDDLFFKIVEPSRRAIKSRSDELTNACKHINF